MSLKHLLTIKMMNNKKSIFPLILILFLAASEIMYCQTEHRVLNYIYNIKGKQTLSGQQGSSYTDVIGKVAGKNPAIWGEDFTFVIDGTFGGSSITESRRRMIEEAKKRWDRGQIISLMFHACPPTQPEPCDWDGGVLSKLTDAQWNELITPGTTLYNNWLARLDLIAVGLKELQNYGAEVLFRPFHEMNQGAFWWGGRPGPNGTVKLYQITHDYLTKVKGITNIIWIWNVQDFSTLASDINSYDPGSDYWDLTTLDVYYSDGTGITPAKYNIMKNKAGKKPFALAELDALPEPSLLKDQPLWTYFVAWRELTQQKNTDAYIAQVYNSDNVLTEDELPGWNNFCPYSDTLFTIPGKIEAENFNVCGKGKSYFDMDDVNTGGAYRTDTGVDIEKLNDSGYVITDIKTNEWLAYSVLIEAAGTYTVDVKVSSALEGKKLHIELNGVNISGTINIPVTGEGKWVTISAVTPVLTPGIKTVKIVMESDGFKLDNIEFSLANKAPEVYLTSPTGNEAFKAPADITLTASAADVDGTITKVEFYDDTTKIAEVNAAPYTYTWKSVAGGEHSIIAVATDNSGISTATAPLVIKVVEPQAPYEGDAYKIPGRIEMENYDKGDEGISYHDLTPGNKFGFYRDGDVDIEQCTDTTGGYSLGDFQVGEWVEYSLNITKAAKYDIELRTATQSTGAKISIIIGSKNIASNLAIPSTGGWQVWKSITLPGIQLAAGNTIMRITANGEYANLNYMKFTPSSIDDVEEQKLPSEFSLAQNYPNPFNPVTTFEFNTAQQGHVTFKIFDILGNEVATLINNEMPAGKHNIEFNASSLSSGVYFYRLTAGTFQAEKKMILMK
jgi:hypothetical protein